MADSATPRGRLAWSPVQVEQLLELHRLGWSASQIGRRVGCTRNAIIGKLSRLLGPSRPYDGLRFRKPKKPKKPRRLRFDNFTRTPDELKRPGIIPREPSTPTDMPTARATGSAAAVRAIKFEECRWPIGDPRAADFRFCGATRDNGGPYCAHHQRASEGRSSHDQDERDDNGSDGAEEVHHRHRAVSRRDR